MNGIIIHSILNYSSEEIQIIMRFSISSPNCTLQSFPCFLMQLLKLISSFTQLMTYFYSKAMLCEQ